jgi:antitoxin component of MazEF toxin-antitoxin module
MATKVKLQKIGNSIRATIPTEVVEDLSLRQGDDMTVTVVDESILLKRRSKRRPDNPAQFYGILVQKTGKVKHWPTPEEIKSIWE